MYALAPQAVQDRHVCPGTAGCAGQACMPWEIKVA